MAKLPELKNEIVCFLISFVSFISTFGMPYFEGRSNTVWALLFFPVDLVPLFLLFACSIMLLFYTIGAFRVKRHFFVVFLTFLISLVLFASWFSVNRGYFYQLGLSNYAKNILKPEEWRDISRFAQQNIKPGDHLWGPKKAHQDDDERKLWAEFTNHTEIQKLGSYVMIYVRADEYTEIMWGGALIGHRGVVIYSNTNSFSLPAGVTFITPDIGTFLSY